MTEVLLQKAVKLPNSHQLRFLANLKGWDGCATSEELGPQTSQQDNSARQTCKRRGWVTFDKYYWRLTQDGLDVLRTALSNGVRTPE
jgi:hypothetical protein